MIVKHTWDLSDTYLLRLPWFLEFICIWFVKYWDIAKYIWRGITFADNHLSFSFSFRFTTLVSLISVICEDNTKKLYIHRVSYRNFVRASALTSLAQWKIVFINIPVNTSTEKRKAECESCELSFNWGLMRSLKAGGEGDNRGWEGWMESPTQWTWVWVNSRSCRGSGRPGVLQSMGLQSVRHDWATERNWTELRSISRETVSTKKRCTTWELSFIWGKMNCTF